MGNGVLRAVRITAVATAFAAALVWLGLAAVWLATRPTAQDLAVGKGRAAGDLVAAHVMQLADGERIDLATAAGPPWERAVLVRAYQEGDAMNAIVGFAWWPSDHWSASDESQRMLAFISGTSVVAELVVGFDTFRIHETGWEDSDADVVWLDPSSAVFIASRDATGFVTLVEP